MASFTANIPDDHNKLIKEEAKRVGMSRQKYLEKTVIEAHVLKLAKKIVNEK